MRGLVRAVICLAVIATSIAGARIMAKHDAAPVVPCPVDPSHLAEKLEASEARANYYRGVADTQHGMAEAAMCYAATVPRKCPPGSGNGWR